MHALINITALTDTGKRHDFGGDTPPDYSQKDRKWVPVVVAADPAFDPDTERLQKAADVITLTELTQSKEVVPLDARTAQRNGMANAWKALDSELRGLFHAQYVAANSLLDQGEDESALKLIEGMDAFDVIKNNSTKMATFNAVKSQFAAALQNLPA